MANPEHVKILKQGVEVWNKWREEKADVKVDLSGINQEEINLSSINFSHVDLRNSSLRSSCLSHADFSHAQLREANLIFTDLRQTDLSNAYLGRANLIRARLQGANLQKVRLDEVNLSHANLSRANLTNASLRLSVLFEAILDNTILTGATLSTTSFTNIDFSQTIGLDACEHRGPSFVDSRSISQSGKLPRIFLKGIGLSDWEIEEAKLYQPRISNTEINDIIYRIYDLRATQSIQIAPMFISYSHRDNDFVDKLGDFLTEKGVRYWRDIQEMKAGRLEKQVDRAMRLNDLVLIVLSENSVQSDWVEHEAKKARRLEKESGKDVMVPIALDDAWKTCKWPARLREQIEEYQVLDFSEWQDEDKLRKQFANLLNGIDLFYK